MAGSLAWTPNDETSLLQLVIAGRQAMSNRMFMDISMHLLIRMSCSRTPLRRRSRQARSPDWECRALQSRTLLWADMRLHVRSAHMLAHAEHVVQGWLLSYRLVVLWLRLPRSAFIVVSHPMFFSCHCNPQIGCCKPLYAASELCNCVDKRLGHRRNCTKYGCQLFALDR